MANNETPPAIESPVPSGKRYSSIEKMLRSGGANEDTLKRVAALSDATRVTRVLAQLRAAHGLTQKEMGDMIGVTQATISKLEAGRDEDLKLGEICSYAKSLGERIGVVYGKPMNHVEAITAYFNQIKFHMLELAKVARNDTEMNNRMNKFFGEAFLNVMEMLSVVYSRLPNGIEGGEFTKEVIHRNPSSATPEITVPLSDPSVRQSRELTNV